jgi:hypothetical protein
VGLGYRTAHGHLALTEALLQGMHLGHCLMMTACRFMHRAGRRVVFDRPCESGGDLRLTRCASCSAHNRPGWILPRPLPHA